MQSSKLLPSSIAFLMCSCVTANEVPPEPIADADKRSCSVYRSIYSNRDEASEIYFRTQSKRLDTVLYNSDPVKAPARFIRASGEFEEIDSRSYPVVETIEQDTEQYFAAVYEGEEANIKNCFETLDQPPGFHSGTFTSLPEMSPNSDHGKDRFRALIIFSPVGFSPDGNFAVLYVGEYCGELCGIGSYVLLQAEGTGWKYVGEQQIWIS